MIITNGVVIRGGGIIDSNAPSGSADFTIPGIYTWKPPIDVSYVDVTVIGAGGGGMSYISSTPYAGSYAAGGGAGLGFISNYPVNQNQVYYIQVGQGGDAGYFNMPAGPGSSGGTGGDTAFNTVNSFPAGGSLVFMSGAGGGGFPPFVTGGTNNGAGGQGGSLNWKGYLYSGGAGQPGSPSGTTGKQGGGAGTHSAVGTPGSTNISELGIGSPLYGPSVTPSSPTNAKVLYGAGGGGSGTNPTRRTSMSGSPGAVRISWGYKNTSLYPRPAEIILLDFIVVAGGGGGGGINFGGGGGAGGYIQNSARLQGPGPAGIGNSYTVIVGAGGTASDAAGLSTPGTNSSWFSNVAIGGGKGGTGLGTAGDTGGSAGGAGGWQPPQIAPFRGVSRTGPSSPTQGSAGGGGEFDQTMGPAPFFGTMAGGGGGAGGAGTYNISSPYPYGPGGSSPPSGTARGGAGGVGRQSSITGTPVYYGGGGGGSGAISGPAGLGGGGAGGIISTPSTGTHGANATVNTGGGGGGGAVNTSSGPSRGGAGGSGVVVISQNAANVLPTVTGSPNVIYNGDKIVYKFWQSGTIQW